MSTRNRPTPLHAAVTLAMALVATQTLAKLILPNAWLDPWTMGHVVGVSALAALVFLGVRALMHRGAERRSEAPRA